VARDGSILSGGALLIKNSRNVEEEKEASCKFGEVQRVSKSSHGLGRGAAGTACRGNMLGRGVTAKRDGDPIKAFILRPGDTHRRSIKKNNRGTFKQNRFRFIRKALNRLVCRPQKPSELNFGMFGIDRSNSILGSTAAYVWDYQEVARKLLWGG